MTKIYEGMPEEPDDTETILATNTMANTLWNFFSALRAKGFKEEYAYGLTLIYFEGMWNNEIEVDADDRKDDCK